MELDSGCNANNLISVQVQEVMDMLLRGNAARTQSPTEANATSSRSHAVLQINVAQRERNADISEPTTMATLSIIDLAGSERASATKNRGERLLEGANINKSLLALGSCINALCDMRKKNHVPYRNSKLTRLLKFSLGGNCRTVMIVCVSPNSQHFDETQNTLRYANRAKNIQTKVMRNVYNVDRHVKDYLKKIDEQMARINELQAQQKDFETLAFAKFRKQEDKRSSVEREGLERIRMAFNHSTEERRERTNYMLRLRGVERRIAAISAWIGSFDQVCETREDEDPPASLVAMRKTANGILVELEGSRQHYHQRLAKSNWERAIDTAVQNGIRQLQEADPSAENGSVSVDSLNREAELMRGKADREAHAAVLEQEKAGDIALLQIMMQANFETIAILGQIVQMSEEEAVQAAKGVLGKLITSCAESVSQVIKPEGGLQIIQAVPPTRSGTPKKKKSLLAAPSPIKAKIRPSLANVPHFRESPVLGPTSPAKASPRRRVLTGARKGVSFGGAPRNRSPVKASKRGVRWRDDTEDGRLAEFQATPPAIEETPQPTPASKTSDEMAFSQPTTLSDALDSSPIPHPPLPSSDLRNRGSGRFQAGFLSKTPAGSGPESPAPPSFSLSTAPDVPSPLREISGNSSSLPQPGALSPATESRIPQSYSPKHNSEEWGSSDTDDAMNHSLGNLRENKDVARKLHSAMRAKRVSSSGNGTLANLRREHRRRSPATNLATSGSPPPSAHPSAAIGGASGMFTASQARRMVSSSKHSGGGDDWKTSVLSPRTQPILKGAQSLSNLRRSGTGVSGSGSGSEREGNAREATLSLRGAPSALGRTAGTGNAAVRPGSSAGNAAAAPGSVKAVWR